MQGHLNVKVALFQLPRNPREPFMEYKKFEEPCLRTRFHFQHIKHAVRTKTDAVSQIGFYPFPEQMNVTPF